MKLPLFYWGYSFICSYTNRGNRNLKVSTPYGDINGLGMSLYYVGVCTFGSCRCELE